ncbi:hypothetical protein UJ11_003561 [Salmonella enterica subsp. enterica]|nr:hypothetical protein [Salmonella enterica subsp. enterica serovar Baguida]
MKKALDKMIKGIEKNLGIAEGTVKGDVYCGSDGKYNANLLIGESHCGGVFPYFMGGGWKTEGGFIRATTQDKWIEQVAKDIESTLRWQKVLKS